MGRIDVAISILVSKLRLIVLKDKEIYIGDAYGIQYKDDQLKLIFKNKPEIIILYSEIVEIL